MHKLFYFSSPQWLTQQYGLDIYIFIYPGQKHGKVWYLNNVKQVAVLEVIRFPRVLLCQVYFIVVGFFRSSDDFRICMNNIIIILYLI